MPVRTPCPDVYARRDKRLQTIRVLRDTRQYHVYTRWGWVFPQLYIEEPDAEDLTISTREWNWKRKKFHIELKQFASAMIAILGSE